MCTILKDVYRKIFDEPFEYDDIEKRIKLQKAVYFMENLGLHVGDYSFSWEKYGPYSVRLNGDAFFGNKIEENPNRVFSDTALRIFNYIKSMLAENEGVYSERFWIECLASVHFLRFISHYDKLQVFEVLKIQKPYLNDSIMNEKAYECVERFRRVQLGEY